MAFLNSLLRPITRRRLLSAYRNYNLARAHRRAQGRTARQVFTDIYRNNRWGGEPGTFCSGSDSLTPAIVAPYVACIRRQLANLEADRLTAVDLGCGDFSVGRQLADECDRYVGVDIVEGLVRHNEAVFGTDKISFQCLDIIEDNLPPGDVCFLRHVLQHLSNEQILRILPRLERYGWTFVTEHQPSSPRLDRPNRDKPHGSDIRLEQSSGVYLEQPPFNILRDRLVLVLEVPGQAAPAELDPGVIRTFVLRSAQSWRPSAGITLQTR